MMASIYTHKNPEEEGTVTICKRSKLLYSLFNGPNFCYVYIGAVCCAVNVLNLYT